MSEERKPKGDAERLAKVPMRSSASAASRGFEALFEHEAEEEGAYSDTFTKGPVKFYLRVLSGDHKEREDNFLRYSADQLGVTEIVMDELEAEEKPENETPEEFDKRFSLRAAAILSGPFVNADPVKYKHSMALAIERYENAIAGGVVRWEIDANEARGRDLPPFSQEAIKKLLPPVKAELYQHIAALSGVGLKDESFRKLDSNDVAKR